MTAFRHRIVTLALIGVVCALALLCEWAVGPVRTAWHVMTAGILAETGERFAYFDRLLGDGVLGRACARRYAIGRFRSFPRYGLGFCLRDPSLWVGMTSEDMQSWFGPPDIREPGCDVWRHSRTWLLRQRAHSPTTYPWDESAWQFWWAELAAEYEYGRVVRIGRLSPGSSPTSGPFMPLRRPPPWPVEPPTPAEWTTTATTPTAAAP